MFGYTNVASVPPQEVLAVLGRYKGSENFIKTEGDENGNVIFYLANKVIDWDHAIASNDQNGIPDYEPMPQYQASPLAAKSEISKATRTRRTKDEIEAAKKVPSPVLPEFPPLDAAAGLTVGETLPGGMDLQEAAAISNSTATATKAPRRFGRTQTAAEMVAATEIEVDGSEDSNSQDVA